MCAALEAMITANRKAETDSKVQQPNQPPPRRMRSGRRIRTALKGSRLFPILTVEACATQVTFPFLFPWETASSFFSDCRPQSHLQDIGRINVYIGIRSKFHIVIASILNMRSGRSSHILLFGFLLLLAPLALSFSWDIWTLFRTDTHLLRDPIPKHITKRLSHQAASDPHQDVLLDNTAWFDTDGTPYFYSAWRAKPGSISPEPTLRSELVRHGARVACWPSSGGVWIKHADLVDLNFLKLSRLEDTPRQFNQTAEDEFCTTLKLTGAEWWQLPASFEKRQHLGKDQFRCDTLEECFEPDIKNHYHIAWPESVKVACYVPISRAEEKGEVFLNRYYNTMDMEERCGIIRSIGGKWCRCKTECPDLEELDWSFRDPGPYGCEDRPLVIEHPDALGA